jgi:hypothetical protein
MRLRRGRRTTVRGNSIHDFEAHLLSAIERVEQDDQAPASRTGRPRRRTIATVVAIASLTLVGASGASALFIGTTGVPALDGLLDVRRQATENARKPGRGDLPPGLNSVSLRADLRPMPETASDPVEVPWAGGNRQGIAYVSQGGQRCFLIASPLGNSTRVDAVTCLPGRQVEQSLDRGPAHTAVRTFSTPTTVVGFTAINVQHLSIEGAAGRFAVRLSAPWQPDVPGVVPVRIFIAFPFGYLDESAPEQRRNSVLRRYEVKAQLEDGRVVKGQPLRVHN